jgi:uncharacterized membrane protein
MDHHTGEIRRYSWRRWLALSLLCLLGISCLPPGFGFAETGSQHPQPVDHQLQNRTEPIRQPDLRTVKPQPTGHGHTQTLMQKATSVLKLKPLKTAVAGKQAKESKHDEIEQVDIYGVVVSVHNVGLEPEKMLVRPIEEEETLQKVTVRLTSDGPSAGFRNKLITIDNVLGSNPAYNIPLKPGARVLINMEKNPTNGQWVFYIANRDRTPALIILGAVFILAALIIGGVEVSKHLLLIILMLLGCYKALFPSILDGTAGANWVLLMCFTFTILASFIYKVPGTRSFNREQSVVILGTGGGLILLFAIMWLMHEIAPLNGYSTEGLAGMWYASPKMDYLTLLMAGALLGFQGFLFYLCWSLAQGRKETEPLSFRRRFEIVMMRGRRILGPLISSLGLLYLGLFMPILLQLQGTPTAQFINLESTVSVLALAFAAGLTLILTVPLTALIAAWLLTSRPEEQAVTVQNP